MSHDHSENIILHNNLHVYYIGFDLIDSGYAQVKEQFYDEIFNDIPAFAFGTDVMNRKRDEIGMVPTIREAMKKIYSIKEIQNARKEYLDSISTEDKYIKRGEFGELILYHLLHEYFGADALISKIYFKDSAGAVAHGFDAVHVNVEKRVLWLGESKLYKESSKAIQALATDIFDHFKVDFLRDEFQIITNRIHDSNQEYEDFIRELLDPNNKILEKLADINICLFAAFESNSLINYDSDTFIDTLTHEVRLLEKKANEQLKSHPWTQHLNIYLLLFPLDDKREFVSALHQKLKGAQQI